MPQRLDRFHIWVNGNIVSNKYASDAEEYGIRMAQNARIYGRTDTNGVTLSKQLAINTKNGVVVAEAVQKISARQMAKGLAAVAGGPLGIALLAAPLVIDWLTSADLQLGPDGSINAPGEATDLWAVCGDGNCSYYKYVRASSQESACTAAGASWAINPYQGTYTCYITFNYVAKPSKVGGTTEPAAPVPQTPLQIEDKLANTNPPPGVLKELADKAGITPKPDPADKPKIQNPQPSQEKVTTKTNPDGSSETTSCRTNGTSTADGSVKLTESCTITKKDPQGNPTGTTTTTSDDADPVPKPDDSLLCSVFPKIAACAELDTPEGEIPTASETIGYTAENHFGGGSCPADKTMTLASTGQVVTVWNWTQACSSITQYFRPLFITLCTLTALFILAPGVKEGA
jgi:hypothetical protein